MAELITEIVGGEPYPYYPLGAHLSLTCVRTPWSKMTLFLGCFGSSPNQHLGRSMNEIFGKKWR